MRGKGATRPGVKARTRSRFDNGSVASIPGVNLFFLLTPDQQRERIHKLAKSRLNAATIASICGMQAAQVERILGGAE